MKSVFLRWEDGKLTGVYANRAKAEGGAAQWHFLDGRPPATVAITEEQVR